MKLLVSIAVPAIRKSFDVRIPGDMKIKELLPLISGTVQNLSENTYFSNGSEILCHSEFHSILSAGETLFQAGVRNGDHLLLM